MKAAHKAFERILNDIPDDVDNESEIAEVYAALDRLEELKLEVEKLRKRDIDNSWALNPERMGR